MTKGKWRNSKEAKANGWFSRRHETNKEHEESVARYKETTGREARRQRAKEREDAKDSNTL